MANADRASPEMMQTMLAAARIPGATLAWDSLVAAARKQFPVPMSYALRPELKHLKPPALFIMGDKDMEGPPALGQQMAELTPHGCFELVPDSGHVIWLDKPVIVAKVTRKFLLSS
jgi:pimeloyl-ACP methyl ester carboxylesterase